MQTNELKHFDQSGATRTQRHLNIFIEQLNEWIKNAENEGLSITNTDQLLSYLTDSQKIKDYFNKLAKTDSKNFKLKSAKNQLFEEAAKTANTLIGYLQRVIKLNYTEESSQPVFWESKVIFELSEYLTLKSGEIFLTQGYETKVNQFFTYHADSKAHELHNELSKAIFYIQKFNELCENEGIPEQKFKIESTLLVNKDLQINKKELCTRSWEMICKQGRKERKQRGNRPPVGTPQGKEPESYTPTGGKTPSKKNMNFPTFTIK